MGDFMKQVAQVWQCTGTFPIGSRRESMVAFSKIHLTGLLNSMRCAVPNLNNASSCKSLLAHASGRAVQHGTRGNMVLHHWCTVSVSQFLGVGSNLTLNVKAPFLDVAITEECYKR